jgi:acyl carrier protein
MSIDYPNVVREAAGSLDFLDPTGELVPFDSLMVLDLVVALEARIDVMIPLGSMRPEAFVSIDEVARLLATL